LQGGQKFGILADHLVL